MIDIPTAQRYARYTVSRMVRAEDVDDVLQDAALLAWRKRRQFRREAKYETWFTTIAVRAALMMMRRRQIEQLPEKFDAVDERAASPERLAAEAERAEKLYAAIEKLSPKRKLEAKRCLEEESATGSTEKARRFKMRESLRRMMV